MIQRSHAYTLVWRETSDKGIATTARAGEMPRRVLTEEKNQSEQKAKKQNKRVTMFLLMLARRTVE